MMKKYTLSGFNFAFPLMVILMLFLQFSFVHAESLSPGEAIQQQIGVNPDDLPKDPEEIKSKYLTQDWEELVNNNKVLGPIHRFLKSFFLFKILLAEPYSLSVTFLIILALWFVIGAKLGAILEASGIIKGWIASAIGFLISVILAQTGVYKTITAFAISVILKESSWWVRTIIALAFILILAILIFLSQSIEKLMKEKREAEEKEKEKTIKKELETFSDELKKK